MCLLQASSETAVNGPATPDQSKDQAPGAEAGKEKEKVKGLPDLGKPRKKADKADKAEKADKAATDKATESSSAPGEPAADKAEAAKA